jgi:3-hydroxyacyl-CoA dehydrogenase/enoyl-CoA hydratase/3-hydroxybutyryl-CoA epimerase
MTDTPPQTRMDFQPPPGPPPGVRMEIDDAGVGWILFDLPGKPINVLTTAVMETLRRLLDEAARRNVSGLVLASDKPDMFVAGADVDEIRSVSDPRLGMEKATYGQAIFETIARFPATTICLITGPCVGGGFEMALACTYRIAENVPSVRIGLPEVKLGVIPGFGGTQRLPRHAGIRAALDLILAGKTLPAKPAWRRGLVDALVPPGQGRTVAAQVLAGARPLSRPRLSRIDRALVLVPFVRNFILGRARDALAKRVKREHYPAPFMALESIGAGFTLDEVAAYRNEARLLGEAIVTDTCKSLTWLFTQSNRAKEPKGLDLTPARPVVRLGLVGAGVMGGGIAWQAAEAGIVTRVRDIAPAALEGALRTAGEIWGKSVKRRRLTPRERDRRLECLSFTLDGTGFGMVDAAVETVVEDLAIKHTVMAELETLVSPDTLLASNTSSLRIGDIARPLRRPERVVGLHFFNPVHRMPLVEVIAGPQSDPRAVATAYRLALDMGKTPVLVQDGPGFLVNRLLSFYLGEALHLFEKGLDPAWADGLLVAFGMPMGPYELLDQIGLDVAEKVTHVIGAAFGERLPQQAVLGQMVAAGHLGKKSGLGFYAYAKGRKQAPSAESRSAAGNPERWEPPADDVRDRLILPMINEAARCLEEGIVARPLDVDLGMVMGTGFPPFRGGLLRYADARGVGVVADRLSRQAETSGARYAPSEALQARRSGFYRN